MSCDVSAAQSLEAHCDPNPLTDAIYMDMRRTPQNTFSRNVTAPQQAILGTCQYTTQLWCAFDHVAAVLVDGLLAPCVCVGVCAETVSVTRRLSLLDLCRSFFSESSFLNFVN